MLVDNGLPFRSFLSEEDPLLALLALLVFLVASYYGSSRVVRSSLFDTVATEGTKEATLHCARVRACVLASLDSNPEHETRRVTRFLVVDASRSRRVSGNSSNT
jgi:hypothetical protein